MWSPAQERVTAGPADREPRRAARGVGPSAFLVPFSATRVRARPGASARHGRRRLGPRRARGRVSRSLRDLASAGQTGLASSPASSSWSPSPAHCWCSSSLFGCPESRPHSLHLVMVDARNGYSSARLALTPGPAARQYLSDGTAAGVGALPCGGRGHEENSLPACSRCREAWSRSWWQRCTQVSPQ
jgi:hypothetical protein